MPFIRHSRDKRGMECTYVMHAYRASMVGPVRTRVLYVFRSPAHLKIGRRPLDAEVMEALEHTHPDLTFDWSSLHRETTAPRGESRDRDGRRDRSRSGDGGRPPVPAPRSQPQPAAPVDAAEQDHSVLGTVLGAGDARRLRTRYEEIQLRIARRSRSPEERDRLTAEIRRLNPDDWRDEAAVRAGVVDVEARWDAIVAELPARRRGRRGGRRRPVEAIMAGDASLPAGSQHASPDSSHRDSSDPDDGGGVGAAAPDPDAGIHRED